MATSLFPVAYFDKVQDINFEKLYELGYRGLIFDIDNTLTTHGAAVDNRVIDLFNRLSDIGFKACLISNNGETRVAPFAKAIDVDYMCNASKPSAKGYLKALEKMGTNRHNTVFIGDQIFTDVFGANRLGIASVLLKPISYKEPVNITLKRVAEAPIRAAYLLKNKINDDCKLFAMKHKKNL